MAQVLTADEFRAWRAYIEGSLALNTRLEEDLRAATGLTLADYHVLVRLAEADGGRLRMGDLAERLVFSPSRLTYQVATMEKRGLVRREPCPDDRRGTRAVLTGAGARALRSSAPEHLASARRRLVDLVSPEELACLGSVFARLGPPCRDADSSAALSPAAPRPARFRATSRPA